jgi:hypothetical protein
MNTKIFPRPMSCPSEMTSLTATQRQNDNRSGFVCSGLVCWSHDYSPEVIAVKELGTFKMHLSSFLLEKVGLYFL